MVLQQAKLTFRKVVREEVGAAYCVRARSSIVWLVTTWRVRSPTPTYALGVPDDLDLRQQVGRFILGVGDARLHPAAGHAHLTDDVAVLGDIGMIGEGTQEVDRPAFDIIGLKFAALACSAARTRNRRKSARPPRPRSCRTAWLDYFGAVLPCPILVAFILGSDLHSLV